MIKELKDIFGLFNLILLSPFILLLIIFVYLVFKFYNDEIEQWFFGDHYKPIDDIKENPITSLDMYKIIQDGKDEQD